MTTRIDEAGHVVRTALADETTADAIKPVIPLRSDQGRDERFDRKSYRERNLVERLINRLKQWRRIATQYEKRAMNYGGMLALAAAVLWL